MNEYIEALQRVRASGISIQSDTLAEYGLDNLHCEKCGDTGRINYTKDGYLYSKDCECMSRRRSLRHIAYSGLKDMLDRYSFDNYETPDDKRRRIKEQAMRYAGASSGWLYICGTPGSGKTHICTAICHELIFRDKYVRYMLWRDDIVKLKACVTDPEEYAVQINRFKRVDALYIDDFLKGKVTEADINIAFELLNFRYNDPAKLTVISSERTLEEVLDIDEAVGSRIYERSKGNYIKAPAENWRLR